MLLHLSEKELVTAPVWPLIRWQMFFNLHDFFLWGLIGVRLFFSVLRWIAPQTLCFREKERPMNTIEEENRNPSTKPSPNWRFYSHWATKRSRLPRCLVLVVPGPRGGSALARGEKLLRFRSSGVLFRRYGLLVGELNRSSQSFFLKMKRKSWVQLKWLVYSFRGLWKSYEVAVTSSAGSDFPGL